MKKLTLFALLSVLISATAGAQKLAAAKVPAVVKAACAKQYPGVAVTWEKEDGKYEASFKKDSSSMSAMFAPDGTFAESEMDIKVTELPAAVLAYVKEHYKGKTIKAGARITKANGTINYEAEVNGKDVIFDANGKFIKQTKD